MHELTLVPARPNGSALKPSFGFSTLRQARASCHVTIHSSAWEPDRTPKDEITLINFFGSRLPPDRNELPPGGVYRDHSVERSIRLRSWGSTQSGCHLER